MHVSFATTTRLRRAWRTGVVGAVVIGTALGSTALALPAPAHPAVAPVPVHAGRLGLATGAVFWSESPAQRDHELADLHGLGVRWLRTVFPWSAIEAKGPNVDHWTEADQIVAAAQAHHLSVIAQLIGAPAWATGGTGRGRTSDYGSTPAAYARFAARFAARYAPRGVTVYELGNEPNHVRAGNPLPNARSYTAVLCAAHAAIRRVAPRAVVLTGGLGGTKTAKQEIAGPEFLRELYADGARGCFEGLSYHPYTYPQLAPDNGTRGWSGMLAARQIMVAHGDSAKKIWATEYGAPTNGPTASHFTSKLAAQREQSQASILTRGYRLFDTYSWAGPLCWFDYQDKGANPGDQNDWFGLRRGNGTAKPAYTAYAALGHTARA